MRDGGSRDDAVNGLGRTYNNTRMLDMDSRSKMVVDAEEDHGQCRCYTHSNGAKLLRYKKKISRISNKEKIVFNERNIYLMHRIFCVGPRQCP